MVFREVPCHCSRSNLLAQTKDQYPFAIVYKQELSLYGFHQNVLTNDHWYEKFNTKVDVGDAIGVTRDHQVLMEWTLQDLHKQAFSTLQDAEKEDIRADAAEWYLSYIFLRQSSKSSEKLKNNLSDNYTTEENKSPATRQETFHYL